MLAPLIMFYFAIIGFFSFGLNNSEPPTSKASIQANAIADFFIKYKDAIFTYCEMHPSYCVNDISSIPVIQLLSKASRNSYLIRDSALYSCKVGGNVFIFSSPTSKHISSNDDYQNELAQHLTNKIKQMESIVYIGRNIGFDKAVNRCGINLKPHHTILVVK